MTDSCLPGIVLRAGGSDQWDHLADLLTDAERERAAGLRQPQDRRDLVAARAVARIVVGELTGSPAEAVELRQLCPTCGSTSHGRPHAVVSGEAVCVSWSHGGGAAAAAAAAAPVGIDIEQVGRGPVVHEVLSAGESRAVADADDPQVEFLRWWTRKETLVKVGACTIDDFAEVDLCATPGRWGRWSHQSWHDRQAGLVVSLASIDGLGSPREDGWIAL